MDGCGADVAAMVVDQGDDHLVAPVLITPLLLLLDPRLVGVDLHHLEEATRLDGLLIAEIHSALNADLVAQAAHHAAGGPEGPFSVDTRGCGVDVAMVVDQGDELDILVLPPVLLLILLDPQLLDLHHLEDVLQVGAACGSGCTAGQQSMHAEVVSADGRLQHEAKHGHCYVSAAARVKQGLVSPPASSCAAAFPRACGCRRLDASFQSSPTQLVLAMGGEPAASCLQCRRPAAIRNSCDAHRPSSPHPSPSTGPRCCAMRGRHQQAGRGGGRSERTDPGAG